jgi:integrase
MPASGCVLRREGARGVSWSVKYHDATGRQVKTVLGREPLWNRQKAERELGKRLDAVEKGYRQVQRVTFEAFAERWLTDYLPGKGRRKGTVVDYTSTIRNHFSPTFGHLPLEQLAASPESFDRYITTKLGTGLSAKTVRNHVVLLGLMFKTARRWGLVTRNPIEDVEPPSVPNPETEILDDSEIAALLAELGRREANPPEDTEREWWAITRRMVVVALGTGLRRGELLGLRWQDVELGERRVRVRQQFTRGEIAEPKSRASRRTVELGPLTAQALEEQFKASLYRADECLVFGHPALGTPLDPSKLTRTYLTAALKAAGVHREGLQPWHGLRHSALTATALSGAPNAYVQSRAGHAQFAVTERYVHAAKHSMPEAADAAEAFVFTGSGTKSGTT